MPVTIMTPMATSFPKDVRLTILADHLTLTELNKAAATVKYIFNMHLLRINFIAAQNTSERSKNSNLYILNYKRLKD